MIRFKICIFPNIFNINLMYSIALGKGIVTAGPGRAICLTQDTDSYLFCKIKVFFK